MPLCYHCGDPMDYGEVDVWHAALPFCYLCAYKRGFTEDAERGGGC